MTANQFMLRSVFVATALVLHRYGKDERDLTLPTADRLARYFLLDLQPSKTPRHTSPTN
jgi:hypothetical protein